MATTTPNFGWPVPTSTDLVKDGATAIEALGDSIDASLLDLKGGTTGQVLSKNSGTDMDFTWVAQDDSNAIQNTIVDAKGDLIAATAADTPSRLAVGTNGQVLTADSTAATGLKWGTIAAGGNWTALSTTSFSASSAVNVNSVFTSDYDNYKLIVNFTAASGDTLVRLRLRASGTDSTANYTNLRINQSNTTLVAAKNPDSSTDYFWLAYASSPYGEMLNECTLYRPFLAVPTMYESTSMTGDEQQRITSRHTTATSYDGFSIIGASANLTGTVRVFGYKNS